MIHGYVLHSLGVGDTGDDLALLVAAGIARARQDNGHGPLVTPVELNLIELAVGAGQHDLDQIVLKARQHDLRLGVAKAGVELQHLGAGGREHKAAVQAAAVVDALGSELGHGLLHDLHHGGVLRVGHDGHRAVNAHAAGIGALVALKRALMVLRCGHGTHGLAVGKGQQRALRANEHFLDNHGVAGVTEGAAKALAHGLLGLLKLGRHDNALARGKTVGLHDQRGALLAHIGKRRGLIGKRAVGSRRNTRTLHELLGEQLGALHLSALGTRTKAGNTRRANGVGHAHHERGLGANHHESASVALGKRRHGRRIAIVENHVLAAARGTAVARRDVELAGAR